MSSNKVAVKIERGPLSPKLDVEMWRVMISEIHPDDDAEKVEMIGMDLFY